MTVKLSDAQRRWLFEMVVAGLRPKMGDVPPKVRDPMVEAGLVELVPNPKGRGKQVLPTEAGWAWVVDHIDEPFTKAVRLLPLWNALTAKLQLFLHTHEESLASVLTTEPPAKPAPEPAEDVLRRVYLRLTEGQLRRSVRLARLREEAPLPRAEVDAALHRARAAGAAVLYPSDDRAALTPEDHAAALDVSGVPKHVVYWER